jgi:hypothetical protein
MLTLPRRDGSDQGDEASSAAQNWVNSISFKSDTAQNAMPSRTQP